jgi:hypothetical protein
MAKLGAAVAEASVSQFPPPGDHVFEIKELAEKTYESGAAGFEGKFLVVESEDKPEAVGRTIYLNIITTKKDGELSGIGAADLKKIVAAVHGKEASEDPEFDTDDLIGQRFAAKLSVTEKDGQENARLSKHAHV